MTKLDITNIWKSVGWDNVKNYHRAVVLETPLIEDFDPNKISPHKFWQAADEHFCTDAVANSNAHDALLNINQTNLSNHKIALYLGMIGQLEMAVSETKKEFNNCSIAEIGCGYGSLYENYIAPNNLEYKGFDVVQRFSKAEKVEGKDGTFTDNQVVEYKEKFNVFYSANVFQHLSPEQIAKYMTQIYKMLPRGGYANIMYVYDVENTFHYGQTVKIIPESEFEELLNEIGYTIISSTKTRVGFMKPFSVLIKK